MKKIIQNLLKKLGYKITRLCSEEKEMERIIEMEGLYRKLVFEDLPPHDKERIRLMSRLEGTSISGAIYLVRYLHKTLELDGDICEFGVAAGRTSALLAHEIRDTNKKIWLFDSFAGLPKPCSKDRLKDDIFDLGTIEKYEGAMAYNVNIAKRELRKIRIPDTRVKIIPGFIETTIRSYGLPEKTCFAYVDFDFYGPILTALNFLNRTLQKGGVIIVDDYDFFSTGAKTAVDEFINANKGRYNLLTPVYPAGKFRIIEKIV